MLEHAIPSVFRCFCLSPAPAGVADAMIEADGLARLCRQGGGGACPGLQTGFLVHAQDHFPYTQRTRIQGHNLLDLGGERRIPWGRGATATDDGARVSAYGAPESAGPSAARWLPRRRRVPTAGPAPRYPIATGNARPRQDARRPA